MLGRRQAFALGMVLSLIVLNHSETRAQNLPTIRHSRMIDMRADSQPGYFTIVGQIGKPGVYQSPQKKITLREIVERAAGQTEQSAGSVRIVRGNRASIRIMLPANYTLNSGDVVIVERKRVMSSTTISPRNFISSRQNATNSQYGIQQLQPQTTAVRDAQKSEGIQLAFVNLVDHPVVVTVREQHANLPAVAMTLLKQDPKILSKIQVIPGEPRPLTAAQKNTTELTNGSILVFEKNAVDLTPIPELPQPTHWDANASDAGVAVETAVIGNLPGTVMVEESLASNSTSVSTTLQAAESLVPQNSQLAENAGHVGDASIAQPDLVAVPARESVPTFMERSQPQAEAGTVPDLFATSETSGERSRTEDTIVSPIPESVGGHQTEMVTIQQGYQQDSRDVPPPPEATSNTALAMAPMKISSDFPAVEPPAKTSGGSVAGGFELLPAVDAEPADSANSPMDVPMPLELANQDVLKQADASDLSTVGLLAAFAVIIAVFSVVASAVWSKLDERAGMVANEESSEQQPQLYQPKHVEEESPRQFLQDVIDDKVPVVEEPVVVASDASLYGDPVASRTYRVDTSHLMGSVEHDVSQPHFVTKSVAAPVASSSVPPTVPIASFPLGSGDEVEPNKYRVDPPETATPEPPGLVDRANEVIQREKVREHRS